MAKRRRKKRKKKSSGGRDSSEPSFDDSSIGQDDDLPEFELTTDASTSSKPKEDLLASRELLSATEKINVIPLGSEKGKEEARKAMKIAEEFEKEKGDGGGFDFLSGLPLVGSERENQGLSLIETGTWIGIFLLIAWEVYINSPLFERAAPMAPVVFSAPDTPPPPIP